MRADRLLSLLLLLQVHRRITARELAKRLEVSERTVHRDMEALSAAGIPVVAERGVGGGWSLLEDYRTNLTGLNEAEIQSLFLTKPDRLLADLGLHQASEAALIKLLAALPAMHRRDAEYIRQRIHVDTAGWHNSEEAVPTLPTLQEAIWQERKLHFTYGRGETTFERLVDPLGLVAKGSVWYLVAAVDGQVRSYRVSRIQEASVADQSCVRPPDFDWKLPWRWSLLVGGCYSNFQLAAYWTQSATDFKANLPRYPVTVRMAPEALPRIHHASMYVRLERMDPPDTAGWVKLHFLFESEEAACGYVLGFGSQVEVVEPPALREQVIRLAQSVVAFYALVTGQD